MCGGAHLHAPPRDSPLGFGKIEFNPFGLAELTRANKQERREAQRAPSDGGALIAINGAQELAERGGLGNGGKVPVRSRSESTDQIPGGIPIGAAARDRESKNPSAALQDSPCRVAYASSLHTAQHREEFLGGDRTNRPIADPGKDIALERP